MIILSKSTGGRPSQGYHLSISMAKELSMVERNKKGKRTVNARDLYEFLDVKTPFSMWIQRRVYEYNFIINVDYVTINKNVKREDTSGATVLTEYYISVGMAKELSMVERNKKGKQDIQKANASLIRYW
jgi:phage anti-repressor protein